MQNRLTRTICKLVILMAVTGPAYADSQSTPKSEPDPVTLVLPYMAVGGMPEGWHFLTVLSIENSRPLANSGTIEFFSGDGRPLHVQLNDSAGLAARSEWRVSSKDSTLLVVSHPGGSFEDGWLRIRLTGKEPIKVILIVQCYNGEQLFAEAGTVGDPGGPMRGPFIRISNGGPTNWRQWRAPGDTPQFASLGPLNSVPRMQDRQGATIQLASQSRYIQPQSTSAPAHKSAIKRTARTETGYASWYRVTDHSKVSANRAKSRPLLLTAAHRTLPLGTRVKVTNLRNGRSVKVRIVDRGPYVPGRIVDLSPAAARQIGLLKEGIFPVRLEPLPS